MTAFLSLPAASSVLTTDELLVVTGSTTAERATVAQLTGTAFPVVDTTALLKGSADSTKLVRFEVDGLTTGTTRVLTVPDASITLAGLSLAQNFSATQTFTVNVFIGPGTMSVGTSGVGVLVLGNSTLPTTSPADEVQVVAADYAAGDSRLLLLSETNTGGIWLGNGTVEAKAPASGAGNALTVKASDAVSGNTNGGTLYARPGLKAGSGANGVFEVTQPGGTPGTHGIQISHNGTLGTLECKSGALNIQGNNIDFRAIGSATRTGILALNSALDNYVLVANIELSATAWRGDRLGMGSGTALIWCSAAAGTGTADTGFARSAAGVVRASNGSTGIGAILRSKLVEANTAGSGAPNVLLSTESGTVLTNEGSTAQNYHTLPTAVAGYEFTFIVQDSDGIRVVAAAGDTIRDLATVSATAGFIQSTTVGSVIRLISINATEWIVVAKQGTWTIDS